MHDQNNVFYALALSVVVLITWQYFFATSFLGKPAGPNTSQISPPQTGVAPIGAVAAGDAIIRPQTKGIATPVAASRPQRIAIDTPRLKGSIALTGGRIDDLALVQYRETSDPASP